MSEKNKTLEAALLTGSRAKNFRSRISSLCAELPADPSEFGDEGRAAVMRLASLCRSVKAVSVALSFSDIPSHETLPEFSELFCTVYYPVMEDGKRTVGFWSVKDSATLAPADVHEWVRGTKVDKKTGKTEAAAVPFGTWWATHRPDYDLYGVASDRSRWNSKVVEANGRKCVNAAYGKPPVIVEKPAKYGDGSSASAILDAVLERTISGDDAGQKREKFVLDAGAHLLALRDSGNFRCLKIFCFTSTNGGQGTGKSLLHESIAALVPRDASVTVPTTSLGAGNLLPLYDSSVCVLTEAPSTASERYTAEDVKAFADAGWKTAEEKYVAKRAVRDNSLKLLSSNHLAPLPIDSSRSRRVEFFRAADVADGGNSLREFLDNEQVKTGWNSEELRVCVGWALLERAADLLAKGVVPVAIARRTVAAEHLLSSADREYFVLDGKAADSYSAYRDWRSDNGFSWSPDFFRFSSIFEMSRAKEEWTDANAVPPPPPEGPRPPDVPPPEEKVEVPDSEPERGGEETDRGFQFKRRIATAYLEKSRIGVAELYAYIVGDGGLKSATEDVREGRSDKRMVLRQVFPGAIFSNFARRANVVGWTGFTHVDFDKISENGNGLTPGDVRDALAALPGFVIGGVSSRNDGAWGIFWAGEGIKDFDSYMAAERSLFAMCEEKVCMKCDEGPRLPTCGRTLAHDPDCRVCDEAAAGMLPDPYPWKAPTYGVKRVSLSPNRQGDELTADERVRNEKFLEAVVEKACERIQNSVAGERHDTCVKAVANVSLHCRERGVTPLSSWGRRLRDACVSCGLPHAEINGVMAYWKQKTGFSG